MNFNQPKKTYTVDEARLKIQNYCAYQERCHKEVIEKLRSMNIIPEVIDVLVVDLIQENFLNELRFAQAFTRGKFRIKKWGKNRIIRELKYRDISDYNIKKALSEISDEDYNNTFNELAEKRLSQIKEKQPQKRKKKLADYLLYRGWESHLVYEKVREFIN